MYLYSKKAEMFIFIIPQKGKMSSFVYWNHMFFIGNAEPIFVQKSSPLNTYCIRPQVVLQ